MISTSENTSLECEILSKKGNCSLDTELNETDESLMKKEGDLYTEHVCSFCNNTLDNEKGFVDHLEVIGIKLPWNHVVSNGTENYKGCSLSLQKVENRISNNIPVVRPFKCNLCGLLFDRISQFDNHRRSVHKQERSQVCQICGKGFFRQTDLKTHLNIHLGTNRCVCEVCGRKFNHVSNLIRHSRTHSGVKPYPCTICGKRFTQINTLARHKAIHKKGDEIMSCCFCDKRYKSESGLKEHMRKLHGFIKSNSDDHRIIKRQHYCNICGESFQFIELLRNHEKSHQDVKTLECKSCDQKFEKADEIKEHRCGRTKLLSTNVIRARKTCKQSVLEIPEDKTGKNVSRKNESILTQLVGINEDSEEQSGSNEIYTLATNPTVNDPKNLIGHELDNKLCQETITSSNKLTEDKHTKETIVYVTTEQLANMNTEQVVDTANHFLHQHLMEIAAESSSQTDNIGTRDCDGETVVSEMIKSCWKEIEMPDVNDAEISEKTDFLSSKNNTQNIIYIHALGKDDLIFLNEMGRNSLGNIASELTPEKSIDTKQDLPLIRNLSLNSETKNLQTIKVCANDSKIRNFKEPSTSLPPKAMRGSRTQSNRNYIIEDNSIENDHISMQALHPSQTHNTFQELLRNNSENVNNIAISQLPENHDSASKVVQTAIEKEFRRVTNYHEKLENSFEFDKIPITATNENENSRSTQNEAITDSLLKCVQLESGRRVLELTSSTSSDKTENCENSANIELSSKSTTSIETLNVFENVDQQETRLKNLSQSKCEKIFYLAQNNKDVMIDFFEIETLETQEQNSFNLVSDEIMENVSQTSFDNLQTLNRNKIFINDESQIDNESCEELLGLIQSNPTKQIEKSKTESENTKKEEGPMVRLVQNEDGAQFFELIRGDLEFDETHNFELVETNELEKRQNNHISNDAETAINLQLEPTIMINNTVKLESDLNRKKKQNNNAKKYNCDVCKKSFIKGSNYRQHIGTHFADQQKFKCKECGTLFAWKSTLNKHMATHKAGGQQKFVCEICPKVYTTLSQVNEHVKRDHLKERNHKCVHCPKTFFKKFDLKIHIRTHTKERPYECRICYKSFHHQSHIIRHERIHSGEKPYACNICERTFTQLGSLRNHRQRHQELKIDILDYQMDEDDPLSRTTL